MTFNIGHNYSTGNDVNLDTIIKIAADSLPELRKCDVFRVLDSALQAGVARAMSAYIVEVRPELLSEVQDYMLELNGVKQ